MAERSRRLGTACCQGFEPIGGHVTLTLDKDVVLRGRPGGIGENKFLPARCHSSITGTITADGDGISSSPETSSLINDGTIGTTAEVCSISTTGRSQRLAGQDQRPARTRRHQPRRQQYRLLVERGSHLRQQLRRAIHARALSGSVGQWSNTVPSSARIRIIPSRSIHGADAKHCGRATARFSSRPDGQLGQISPSTPQTGSYLGGTIRGGTLTMNGPGGQAEVSWGC